MPPIVGPEAARKVVLAYIRTYHAGAGPVGDAFWFEETVSPEGLVGSSTLQYRYESWVVTVTYPVVAPEATIYTVSVENPEIGFEWQGLSDAYGQVVEVSFRLQTPTATSLPLPTATATPPPTATQTPLPTATLTPVPTSTTPPTATETPDPNPCNAAQFVKDVTVQDGTTFYPGVDFSKTWRLKNVGVCTWTTSYDLVFVSGSQMDSVKAQALPAAVKPGETVDLSLSLKAPKSPGDYQGFWMLRDANGVLFGLGEKADKAFWVSVNVVDFNEGSYNYDFALNYCAATWRSDTQRLPCPGFTGSADGFAVLLSRSHLENRQEDEPTLWVHPREERYAWIEGTYPAYKVKEGDVFKAWVGCMEGNNLCSLRFYLDYIDENGKVRRLGEWLEVYDGDVTDIQLDLSALAGQSVRFILGVEANTKNVKDAQGFWFVPHID